MLAAAPVSLLLVSATASAQVAHPVAVVAPAAAADTVDTAQNDTTQDDATTTTIVASESPNPGLGQGGPAPEIGPIVVPADSSSFSGAWWLVAFGGVQLVGLFFITRRARTRLSTRGARS